MRITADTNVLLRLILADDEMQSLIAVETMGARKLGGRQCTHSM